MTRPLVGVDEVTAPDWLQIGQQAAGSGLRTALRSLPGAVTLVSSLAWRTSRRLTLAVVVLQLAAGCVAAFGLLATADVLTALLAGGPTPDRLVAALPAVAQLVALLSGRAILDALGGAAQSALRPRIEQAAQHELHRAVADVSLIAFEDSEYVDLLRQGQERGVRSIEISVRGVTDLAKSMIQLVAAVVTAGLLHPLLAPLVLFAVVPEMLASARAVQLQYHSFLRMVSLRRRQSIASGLLTGRATAAEMRACTAGPALLAEYLRISTRLTKEAQRVEMAKSGVNLVGRAVAGLGTAIGFGVLGLMLYADWLPLALAGTAVMAMRLAGTALSNSMAGVTQIYENSLYIDLYTTLLQQTRRHTTPVTGKTAPSDPRRISLEAVSFTYPGQPEPALRDLNLVIRKGQTVALVGENGSGKTTLAKLLTGLYAPNEGRVCWNGIDLATVDAHTVHDRIAIVAQDPARWPMSAYDNIRIGRLESPNDLDQALAGSGADEVIAELPAGGDTVLSREFKAGRDLSGGQWQRIGLARGLYRDAPILVADEPTAAMDARAEQAAFESLRRIGTGRTKILITHRLVNVRYADLIVVLEHGRIVEQGSHAELLARGGVYAGLYELQASAYLSPDPRAEPERLLRPAN
ncbi:ABC transporter ATP-binding protein [Kribbella sp. NPDC056951]|uniref:ABC transporter ATP-binding protein n=1 Tax=Kribbella sp. NPDC056951 TaxID=3345978 RepID=UPI003624F2B3